MKKTELGAWGEEMAAQLLLKKGYRIAERNYRCRMGEIDLIARKDRLIVFVEVKLRKNRLYGEAREFVTASKQRKILVTASFYLAAHPRAQELQARFDVVEVYAPQGKDGPVSMEHLEDAFQ